MVYERKAARLAIEKVSTHLAVRYMSRTTHQMTFVTHRLASDCYTSVGTDLAIGLVPTFFRLPFCRSAFRQVLSTNLR